MPIVTKKFLRNPLYVDAVRVTPENFLEMAFWCQGSIRNNDGSDSKAGDQIDSTKQHIQVRVHNPKNQRQSKAYVGDWVLHTERGYKVYTDKAFKSAFSPIEEDNMTVNEHQGTLEVVPEPAQPIPSDPVPEPHEPTPAEPTDPDGQPVPVPDEVLEDVII